MKIKEGEDNEYRQLAVNDEQQSRFLKTSTIDLTRNGEHGQDISLPRRGDKRTTSGPRLAWKRSAGRCRRPRGAPLSPVRYCAS